MRLFLVLTGLLLASATNAEPAHGGSQKARANYILHCSGCHGTGGMGTIEGGVPGFPDSLGYIASLDIGRDYILKVPGVVNTRMSDEEISEVLNYILDEWVGAAGLHFSADEVSKRRAGPVMNVVAFRREIALQLQSRGIEIANYPWP